MRTLIIGMLIIMMSLCFVANAQVPSDSAGAHKGTLYVVGVSHLDTQWRWTIKNTIDEYIPNTFHDNVKLMDLFPHYTFSFEGAFKYMLLKEYYPEDYEKLKGYIADGRWRVAGGWVDPVDVNIPSFESLVRHTLYGNGYFKREFGKTSRDVLLPDCFGFGYSLPSIAAHCGLESFSTQKLTWGSSVGIPFDIGIWEGVDGSTVVAALNPGSYGSQFRDDLSRDTTWAKRIERQGDTSGLYAAYRYFGTGDIGGSPDSESVAWLEKSIAGDGPIEVQSIGSDDLADIVASAGNVNLPRYKGELLMTRHGVGCYTSQAAMKRWNRKNELLADAAERASVIAHMLGGFIYPRRELKETWIRFLWHQFHDDITGTSIPEAYEFSWNDEILCLNEFSGMLENAAEATTPALDTRGFGIPVVVYNPLAIAREDIVEATVVFDKGAPKAARVFGPDGTEVPSQVAGNDGNNLTVLFLAHVPSVGYAVYDVRPAESPCTIKTGLRASAVSMENGRYEIKVNANGDVSSIVDKTKKQELLAAPITLQLLYDKPTQWPAWEIQYEDIIAQPVILSDPTPEIRIIENGPARISLEVIRRTERSVFRTVIRLASGDAGNRVEFVSDIDWYEKETLLKAAFKLNTANAKVTYDLGLGTIQRGISHEKLYEVPGQQWADMTSGNLDYGVAVLNDCRYGWDHPDSNTLRLTLVHTPGVHDNWSWVKDERSQDMGHHTLTYAVTGHSGDWRAGLVPWEAARLNQPLRAFQVPVHEGNLGKEFSLLEVTCGNESAAAAACARVMVNAVKLAEISEEVVVRVKEITGAPAEYVRLRFNRPIAAAREINGSEEPLGDAVISDGTLLLSLAPYQPKAFAVTFQDVPEGSVMSPIFWPLTLPYNLDGISLDSNRADGDFDGQGYTLAGDVLPETMEHRNITFTFGPRGKSKPNVVACGGETIDFPAGRYDRLYLVAAAVGGPAEATFKISGPAGTQAVQLQIPDYAEPIGQWNNRMVGGAFMEEPDKIAPAYINRTPVAWYGSHRHTPDGRNESYRFTYMFLLTLKLPEGATALTLPNYPRIRLLAATLATAGYDDIRPAQPLYDVADNTLAKIQARRTSFVDSTLVSLTCPIPGAAIHYTLDGRDPTSESQRYFMPGRPIVLAHTTTVKARAILDGFNDSHVTSVTFNKLIPREPDKVDSVESGLNCLYYEGDWTKLPDFNSLTPKKESIARTVAIPKSARKEGYGLVFTGYVQAPKSGLYDFIVSSDDGSAMRVGDSIMVDNDGIHGDQEASLEIALKAGLHPITVWMFQAKGGQALSVSYQGPGFEKTTIPAKRFFHAVTVEE